MRREEEERFDAVGWGGGEGGVYSFIIQADLRPSHLWMCFYCDTLAIFFVVAILALA